MIGLLLTGWALLGTAGFVAFALEVASSGRPEIRAVRSRMAPLEAVGVFVVGLLICLLMGPLAALFAWRVILS